MLHNMQVTIGFYPENDASVEQITDAVGEAKELADLLMFASVTLRQLTNLSRSRQTAALVDQLSAIRYDTDLLTEELHSAAPILRDFVGPPAPRRFLATLESRGDAQLFRLVSEGFPFFGSDLGVLAPRSIIALLKFLTRLHFENDTFLRKLASSTYMCGQVFTSGKLSPLSQHKWASAIAQSATSLRPTIDIESGDEPRDA